MAKNFVQHGNTVTCIAPTGGVVSGRLYRISALAVVAATDAAVGEEFEGHTKGVWNFNQKTLANTPAVFALAYLTSGGEITTTASGNTLIGVFTQVGVNGSNACQIRLNGVAA